MVDVGVIVAAMAAAFIFRWLLFRAVNAGCSWLHSSWFIGPPSADRECAQVAETPYEADQVVHTVGGWQYCKMRLGIGPGPRALCGFRLYAAADVPCDESLIGVSYCPDCEQVWLRKHPAPQVANDE